MINKYLSLAKNSAITTVATVLAGMGASDLTSRITDDSTAISTSATVAQYVVGWAVFFPLQAWDNRESYRTEQGKFDKKGFLLDNLKFGVGLIALDLGYLVARPFLQNKFLDEGRTPAESSLNTDYILIPAYTLVALGVAKMTGILRKDKKKESKLEEKVKDD